MQRRVVILIILIFLLLGCTWTKQFLSRNGDSGDHTTIPIDPNELLEMAYYCDEAYAKATPENKLYEIAGANKNNKDEFSYHVKQDSGVTILIFRGTSNRDNVLTDIDFRPFKDGALSRHHRIDL